MCKAKDISSIKTYVDDMLKSKEAFISWIENESFGPDGFCRYGIEMYAGDKCATTRVSKDNEYFDIQIIIQKDREYKQNEEECIPFEERDWDDIQWHPFMGVPISHLSQFITDETLYDLHMRMKDLLLASLRI